MIRVVFGKKTLDVALNRGWWLEERLIDRR